MPEETGTEISVTHTDKKVDWLNAVGHTYSAGISWMPSDDMQTVTASRAVFTLEGQSEYTRTKTLVQEQSKIAAALYRGGISAKVTLAPRISADRDHITITMPIQDYTGRYLPILCGEQQIDTSIPHTEDSGWIQTIDVHYGYEPEKRAFIHQQDFSEEVSLLISQEAINEVTRVPLKHRFKAAQDALEFLRATGFVTETHEKIPVAAGEKADFMRLSLHPPKYEDGKVYQFDGTYYNCTDLDNALRQSLYIIEANVNGRREHSFASGVKDPQQPDNAWFAHGGDMYIPRGKAFRQIALHMQSTYGIGYSWVIGDPEAKEKAGDKDKYIIYTSRLNADQRHDAMQDLHQRLERAIRNNSTFIEVRAQPPNALSRL